MNLLNVHLRKLDGVLEKTKTQTAKAGKPVICQKGCYFCCKEAVYVYRKEATHILEKVYGDLLQRVKERTRVWVDKFKASGMASYPEPPVVEYRRHNMWCPFLENGECSVYDRRPAPCRIHMAVGPLERCQDDELRARQLFAYDPEELAGLNLDMNKICEPVQSDHLGVWLAEILLKEKIPTEARFHLTQKNRSVTVQDTPATRGFLVDGLARLYRKQFKPKEDECPKPKPTS